MFENEPKNTTEITNELNKNDMPNDNAKVEKQAKILNNMGISNNESMQIAKAENTPKFEPRTYIRSLTKNGFGGLLDEAKRLGIAVDENTPITQEFYNNLIELKRKEMENAEFNKQYPYHI